ncbi:Hypothetical protein PBC10988_7390 [Planctomycetales bacterium 10988]|nr:Hypothetical protein PBC10988_7390 [Planctomycetales bacterium 10988]
MSVPTKRSKVRTLGSTCLLGLLLLIGCNGCEQEEPEGKVPPLPPFELRETNSIPAHNERAIFYKPGHWQKTASSLRANEEDFRGEAEWQPPKDRDRAYSLTIKGSAILPKGQTKQISLPFFTQTSGRRSIQNGIPKSGGFLLPLEFDLTYSGSERAVLSQMVSFRQLLNHQSVFVVLSEDSSYYQYFESLPAFYSFFDYLGKEHPSIYQSYFLSSPLLNQNVDLPDHLQYWTTISHVLWDGVPQDALSSAQETALLDWIHQGGRLIISGPESLSNLHVSFLAEYLPGKREGNDELTLEELRNLSQPWTTSLSNNVFSADSELTWPIELIASHPASSIQIKRPSQGPTESNTPLVLERKLGQGSILLTAFSLKETSFRSWIEQDDRFFNQVLLGNPPREFNHLIGTGDVKVAWHPREFSLPEDQSIGNVLSYPQLGNRVSFFTRDAISTSKQSPRSFFDEMNYSGQDYLSENETLLSEAAEDAYVYSENNANWNDRSEVSQIAEKTLINAAGIKVPSRTFLLVTILSYLFCLAPINYILFRLLQRVEWAWIAVPVITLIATAVIIYSTQVNIGFSQASTKLTIIEGYGDYPRVHSTSYVAVYTSLSDQFNFQFQKERGFILPMEASSLENARWNSAKQVTFQESNNSALLTGFHVDSNSIGLLHAEEMLTLSGSIMLKKPNRSSSDNEWELINQTSLSFRNVVLRKNAKWYYTKELKPQETLTIDWIDDSEQSLSDQIDSIQWEVASTAAEDSEIGEKALREGIESLYHFSEQCKSNSEVQMMAWSEKSLGSLTMEPEPGYQRGANFFYFHLLPKASYVPSPYEENLADVREAIQEALSLRNIQQTEGTP